MKEKLPNSSIKQSEMAWIEKRRENFCWRYSQTDLPKPRESKKRKTAFSAEMNQKLSDQICLVLVARLLFSQEDCKQFKSCYWNVEKQYHSSHLMKTFVGNRTSEQFITASKLQYRHWWSYAWLSWDNSRCQVNVKSNWIFTSVGNLVDFFDAQ